MSDGLSKLRGIGAQKIHELTHIARHHVQAVLHETFDDMNKIQFLGFISILEREYGADLSDLKAKGQEFYAGESPKLEPDTKVFVSSKKKKSYTLIYILVVVIIFAVAVSFTLDLTSAASTKAKTHTIDNSAIENAKDSMSQNAIIEDEKTTIEDNNTTIPVVIKVKTEPEPELIPEVEPEVIQTVKSFKLMPRSELWVGYIDLSNYKKYQKLFKGELDIDPNKNWILTLGHGYLKVEIDGEITEFRDKKNIRLLYKDSKLSRITFSEFKELNKGSKW
ncbi:hypothetical protein [Sulfurimonas sp.]|uniref:hypothetical protein n=1 Tax=Sulfurimonas sp. TaxID=2022749 RepID=UPI0025EF1662|nr:hypothetical protein [Sulfurimonas sp.]